MSLCETGLMEDQARVHDTQSDRKLLQRMVLGKADGSIDTTVSASKSGRCYSTTC